MISERTFLTRAETCERFQILALDGGGLKGLFSAQVLGHVEEDTGTRIVDHFDLIAGTSTGGIIALALSIGMRPTEIVNFYSDHGPRIFPQARRGRVLRPLYGPRYRQEPLREALKEVFGDRLLGDAERMLVIPSYDIDNRTVHLFRTPHSARLTRDLHIPMVDVALATSAAPTFLPAAVVQSVHLIDGGVWANNPTMVAVTEAGGELGLPLSKVRVLSLGTTSEVKRIPSRLAAGGLLSWGCAIPSVFLEAQAQTAFNQAYHLLGREEILRINPVVAEGEFRLDLAHPEKLRGKAANVSRHSTPEIKEKFLDHIATPYKRRAVTAEAVADV
jgi:patatin-like phospholipase/acyl hydrolase